MKKLKFYLIVITIAIFLTTIFTWPFVLHLTDFYTDQGDYTTHGSILWWNQDSLKTGRIFNQQEYFRGYMFYPHPYSLAFANNHVFPSLIFAPIYWITNSLPFSINFYVFLTFVLTFTACFYFLNFFVRNRWAAMVGSFIFTFNPQIASRFPQHIELLGKYFLPLIFLFAYKLLDKPNFKDAFWLFLFITLNSLTANYFQIFTYYLLPLAALPFILKNLWHKDWAYFLNLGKVSLVGLIFIPILLYFNLPFWQFAQKEGSFRTVNESIFFSARITDWFATTTNNLLYGGWTKYLEQFRQPKDDRGILNYEEHTLFISLLAFGLFLYGLRYFWKQHLSRGYFLLILGAAFILTFGPYLNYSEEGFKLPFYYLYQLIPLMKGIRAPSRFEYIFLIPFALIVAFGVKNLLEQKKNINFTTIIIIIIFILLILENFTLKNYDDRSYMLTKVQSLGSSRLGFLKGKVTFHLPVYTSADESMVIGKTSFYTNWLTQTGERMVNGNSGYFPPDIMALTFELNDNFDQTALEKLSLLGVNYVIIHKDLMTSLEVDKLSKVSSLISQGKIFDETDVEIIDLSKYNFSTPACILEKDFDIRMGKVADPETEKNSYALVLQNRNDCFLVSVYDDRYRKITVEVDGIKRWAQFRLPVLINPHEQMILSEINEELKLQ